MGPRNWTHYFAFLQDLPELFRIWFEDNSTMKLDYGIHGANATLDQEQQLLNLSIRVKITTDRPRDSFWSQVLGISLRPTVKKPKCPRLFILQASINLSSWSLDHLDWQLPSSPKPQCVIRKETVDFQNYKDTVVQNVQTQIMKSWKNQLQHYQKEQVLDLTFGARLYAQFQPPRVKSVGGGNVIAGSVLACARDRDDKFQVISPQWRALGQPCHDRPVFTTYVSKENQAANVLQLPNKSVVFKFAGTSKVAVQIADNGTRLEVQVIQSRQSPDYGDMGWRTEVSLSARKHAAEKAKNTLWSRFVLYVDRVLSFIRGAKDKPKATPVQFQSQRPEMFFWLALGNGQASFGRGKVPYKRPLKEMTLPRDFRIHNAKLYSYHGDATWQVSVGKVEHVCRRSIPTDLVEQGRGFVRLAAQMFEIFAGMQLPHLQNYVFKSQPHTFEDARLSYNFAAESIQLAAPKKFAKQKSLLGIEVTNSRGIASCHGREQPLLDASLGHFQGSLTAVGHQDDNGQLKVSVAFTNRKNSYAMSDWKLSHPSIPLSVSAADATAKRLIGSEINQQLQKSALMIPNGLAKFIPCNQIKDSCQLRASTQDVYDDLGADGYDDLGFFEFSASSETPGSASASPANSIVADDSGLGNCDTICCTKKHIIQYYKKYPFFLTLLPLLLWLCYFVFAVKNSGWLYGVSLLMLSMTLGGWLSNSPLSAFANLLEKPYANQLRGIEKVRQQLQATTRRAQLWTLGELIVAPWWTMIFDQLTGPDISEGHKKTIAYWCFSCLVFVSQFWLLVGSPMSVFLGGGLEAFAPSSSVLHFMMAWSGETMDELDSTADDILQCSFTATFVSYMGLYLMFFLLPLAPGAFIGSFAFVIRLIITPGAEHFKPTIVNTATLCILITELLSSAAVLGPFLIAYEILGGTVQWWLAWVLIGVCRPFFAVPYCRLVHFIQGRASGLALTSLSVLLAYVVLSFVGAALLWEAAEEGLVNLAFGLGCLKGFALGVYVTNLWFFASSAFMLLHDISSSDSSSDAGAAQECGTGLQTAATTQCRQISTSICCICGLPGLLVNKFLQFLEPRLKNLEASWNDCLFLWLVWFLEMDAVVSCLYHGIKVLLLGYENLLQTLDGAWFFFEWVLEPAEFSEKDLWSAPDLSDVKLEWPRACLIFAVCSGIGWAILLYARAGSGSGRAQRTADIMFCSMRPFVQRMANCILCPFQRLVGIIFRGRRRFVQCVVPELETFLEEALLDENRQWERAISNYSRVCDVDRDLAKMEVRRSWAGVEGWTDVKFGENCGDYRREFLLFGFLHGSLAFIREFLRREAMPHTWGILSSKVAEKVGIQEFHNSLNRHKFPVTGNHTALDYTFVEFDLCVSISLTLQLVLWVLIFASLCCELKGSKAISQWFGFAGGAVAVISGLTMLVPNYANMSNVAQYFVGCGKEFDNFVEFSGSAVLGMIFAVPLGLQIFTILLTIPISAVRGMWFVMMMQRKESPHRKESPLQFALHGGMWLIASLIPFVTVFPLLFINQFTHVEAQNIVFAFWVLPSLFIVAAGKSRSKSWFYFAWLTLYIGLADYFAWHQFHIFEIDFHQILAQFHLPCLWSMMHSDFCLTNVIITDLPGLVFVVDASDQPADSPSGGEAPKVEMRRTGVCAPVHQGGMSTDDIQQLPGFQSSKSLEGMTLCTFDTANSARNAAMKMFPTSQIDFDDAPRLCIWDRFH